MTNLQIDEALRKEVITERKTTLTILNLINLAEDQRLPLERGFKSTHDWLIREHKYSESAANRRIQAARLLKSVPAVAQKLTEGSVNLTTLTKAQAMIRVQEKKGKVSKQQKAQAIKEIENKSLLQAEQALMKLLPENVSHIRQDRVTVVNENVQRLSVNLTNEAIAELERAKEILSHTIPSGQANEVITYVLKEFVKRADPLNKKPAAAVAQSITAKQTIRRDRAACTYEDPETGRVCGSRFQIERDHIIPRANGGDDSPENARALCRKHNQFMAEKILGESLANCWRISV